MAGSATESTVSGAVGRQGRTEKTVIGTEPGAWPNGPTPWGTPAEVARYLGTSQATLCRMRAKGDGPRWAALTDHCARYHVADVEAWMESRKAA